MITSTNPVTEEIHLLENCVINLSSNGVSSSGLPTLPANTNFSALRVVSRSGTGYSYSDPNSADSVWSIAGLVIFSVNAGVPLTPVRNQVVSDESWNWVRGSPIFLGTNGTLTQTAPLTGYLVVVAKVLDSKTIFVQIEEPIDL